MGASNPVRDLDLMVAKYAVGDRRMVVGNRGLAGIDGSVSSAVGAALGRPRSTRAIALLGDVTFLHDTNGLLIGPGEERPDLTIVVVNDDGGSIFASLEQGGEQHAASYDKLFGTPHGVDVASPVRRDPHAALEGRLGGRAVARAGQPGRRHRGGGGRRTPGRPPRAGRRDPGAGCARLIKRPPARPARMGSMSTAADHFTGFVDVLADALDDHEATGEDLAGRLYLSRFHLDRIVASVAGESPSRFRRRILLERSAYRLATTRRTILDIAVEAGLRVARGVHPGLHQGVRRRARPVARARPTRMRIEAPSDVHFHPPGSLRLPAEKKVTPMDLLTKMVEHHVWLTGEIVERAARLSDAQLDEPIELNVDDDHQTIRSLASRLVGQMGMWNAAIANREYDWSVEEHESVDSLRARLAVEGPAYLAQVREVAEQGRLDDTFVDALCEPAEVFTYGGMIAHVLTFAAHRRCLVVMALDRHGVPDLGWGDPMRWVAQSA